MKVASFIATSLLVSTATAMWKSSSILAESCGRISKGHITTCEEIDDQCYCGDRSYLKTVSECILVYSNGNTTDSGDAWDHFLGNYCDLKNAVPINRDFFDIIAANITYEPVGNIPFLLGYRAMYNHLEQKDISAIQGGVLTGYWLAIPLIVSLGNFFSYFCSHLGTDLASYRPKGYYLWLQRYLFIPALFNNKHMQKIGFGWFRTSIGTRFDSMLIGIYFLLNVIFMLCPYTFMDLDPFYDTRWKQMMRYGSDRSGIIATVQFPLLILFATRNNILIWMTGWSYASFNRFHRAISRTVYALLIIHSVMKHIFSASYGSSLVLYFYPIPYYRYGVAAMFLFAIMIFVGYMRSRFYDFFLITHLLCALGGLIMSILHLKGIGYQQPLYICLALWGADLLIRVLRILVFNFSIFLLPIVGHRKVTYSSMKVYHQELTSVSVKLPVKWTYHPGQYVYLHTSIWTFLYGGHPFSVVGENRDKNGLELVIKGRSGFTQRLKNQLTHLGCTSELAVTTPCYIEGPYGVTAPVEDYGEVLLFAGGIGITGILGYVDKLTSHGHDISMHKIVVVWTVPKRDDFKPFIRHIYQLQKSYPIDFQLYCRAARSQMITASGIANVLDTQPAVEVPHFDYSQGQLHSDSTPTLAYYQNLVSSRKEEEDFGSSARDSDSLDLLETKDVDMNASMFSGRPDIPTIVDNFCTQSQSSVCVVSCGPATMVDQIRDCVAGSVDLVRYGKLSYFEEAFEW